MGPAAASSALRTTNPVRVAREVGTTAAKVHRPSGGLVFVAGTVAGRISELSHDLATAGLGIPLLVVPGAGVLTEQGEIERDSAASTIVWGGGRARAVALPGPSVDQASEQLASILSGRGQGPASAVAVFLPPAGLQPDSLSPLCHVAGSGHIFGAGTVGDTELVAVDEEGSTETGPAAAMIISGLSPPIVSSSPACRLLTPLLPITETDGPLVLKIGEHKALDLLNSVGSKLANKQLLLTVLAGDEAEESPPPLLVRGIRGVDPLRGAMLVSPEARPGVKMALAVRDASAARSDLQRATRQTQRAVAGAAPRFGLYLDCAGRGSALYSTPDVDTRILRSAFGEVPFAGMHSSFEIVNVSGRPTLQLYSGVVALFTSPS